MNVVFVAPYLGAHMVHCLNVLVQMDVRVGVISHQSIDRYPPKLRAAIDGHYRIDNALDAAQLATAVRAFQSDWGEVHRLLGYLEQLQEPLAEARDQCGVAGMGADVARNFRDKNKMKEVLRAAGLPVARQARVESLSDAESFIETVGYPVVMKPIDGMGSRNTQRVQDHAGLLAAFNVLMPGPGRAVQCEEFVTGAEHTCETVLIDGEPVWRSSTHYLPGPLKVLENPWMQYCVLLPKEEQEHVTSFADTNVAALRALGLDTGLTHMEWFLRADGTPVINEVGARPPGVNIMRLNALTTGADLWQNWLDVQIHQRWSVPDTRTAAAGCAFLRGQGRGRRVVAIEGIEALKQRLGDALIDAKWPRIGQARSSSYEGEGWVIVSRPTTEATVAALRTAVTTVRIQFGD